jgi:hypothetical protein
VAATATRPISPTTRWRPEAAKSGGKRRAEEGRLVGTRPSWLSEALRRMADQDGGAEPRHGRCVELQPEVTVPGATGSSAGCRAATVQDAERRRCGMHSRRCLLVGRGSI